MNRYFPILGILMVTSQSALGIDACGGPPVSIPDNSAEGIVVPITVEAPGMLVGGVTVDLDLTHPWVGDLVVTLQSPGGVLVTLLDRAGIPSVGFPGPFGCGGQDIGATFDDSAILDAETMCSTTAIPVISGQVGPGSPLSAMAGDSADGVWLLTVSDRSAYDAGTLNSVCLQITTVDPCTADLTGDGELDVFDVFAYLDLYTAQDLGADFTGDGLLDVFDVFAFLEAFNAGCV